MHQEIKNTRGRKDTQTGYIVDIYQVGEQICVAGRLDTGETFKCMIDFPGGGFYIRSSDSYAVEKEGFTLESAQVSTLGGEQARRVLSSGGRSGWEALHKKGIATYEADFSPAVKFQIEYNIKRMITVSGRWQAAEGVDRVYVNPDLQPARTGSWSPELRVLSLDIETAENDAINTIALIGYCTGDGTIRSGRVLTTLFSSGEKVEIFDDECALLQAFATHCRAEDPDIILGWNVIDFDLRILKKRCETHRIPFTIGRSGRRTWVSTGGGWGRNVAMVDGRQVVDVMAMVRRSPKAYDDYSLETVARSVLGKGKLIAGGIEVLDQIQQSDPDRFAAYCLEDALLVIEIAERENLLQLALRRSIVTGLPAGRADGAVAAFDLMYGMGLRAEGLVSPTSGVDKSDTGGAPGGLVLPAKPGLFRDVMVFDFKSLYPSIMMTFNIDPMSYTEARKNPDGDHITAPNGAAFARDIGVLADILQELWESRDKCRQDGDEVGSHSYKITLNSFYGVLAGPCRFANPRIAGAITEFGHYLLKWTKDTIENAWDGSFEVLYGDTDSLFVRSEQSYASLEETGNALCSLINRRLSEHVMEKFDVRCRLELEFEKAYSRFIIPYTRGKDRGRAKGYAGAVSGEDGTPEIVGMEAVRRDWTDLAHNLQKNLLRMIFSDQPREEIEGFIWREVCAVNDGLRDELLVYRKRLRKDIARYATNRPPHVRAAILGDIKEGVVRYVITLNGPEPEDLKTAPMNYKHYIDKQITPIVDSLSMVFPFNRRSALLGEQELFKLDQ